MIFTKRTGLENMTNQAVHELVEERKKKHLEEPDEQAVAQEQPKENAKEATASFTYGNLANQETHRMLFSGSYHTFTTNSSNQLQCTCCPEPILMKAIDVNDDFSIGKEDKADYSFASGTESNSYTDSFSTKKKSGIIYK